MTNISNKPPPNRQLAHKEKERRGKGFALYELQYSNLQFVPTVRDLINHAQQLHFRPNSAEPSLDSLCLDPTLDISKYRKPLEPLRMSQWVKPSSLISEKKTLLGPKVLGHALSWSLHLRMVQYSHTCLHNHKQRITQQVVIPMFNLWWTILSLLMYSLYTVQFSFFFTASHVPSFSSS